MNNKILGFSKYWVEINNWRLPTLDHIGLTLWGMIKKHILEYRGIRNSLEKFGELKIIHYIGSRVSHDLSKTFIGESVLSKENNKIVREYSWSEIKKVLRKIFLDNGISSDTIDQYFIAIRRIIRPSRSDRFFLFRLAEYRKYENPVKYDQVRDIISHITWIGRYLVPIRPEDYEAIHSRGLEKTKPRQQPSRPSLIDYREFREYVSRNNGFYADSILNSIVSGYNKGKHLLLVGPPGTGKSYLTELLADYLNYELVSSTASSTWTRYDFIGGPIISSKGFKWRSGVFLLALAKHIEYMNESSGNTKFRGVLLLIDELNRCEADKVLAEFFTIYPGVDPSQWRLPQTLIDEIKSYDDRDEAAEIILKYIRANNSLPWGFRVIATINTWDITHLYTLGYALLRRFHIIRVFPQKISDSEEEVLKRIVFNKARKVLKEISNVDNQRLSEVAEELTRIYKIFINNNFPLGIAYIIESVIDAYNLISMNISKDIKNAIDEALSRSLASILDPEISKIMIPKKYIDALVNIKKLGKLDDYRGLVEMVDSIVSKF